MSCDNYRYYILLHVIIEECQQLGQQTYGGHGLLAEHNYISTAT